MSHTDHYLLNTPDVPVARLLLAHGAGAAMDSEFMHHLASALCERDVAVVRFEFPYMTERRATGTRRPPNPFARIVECYEGIVDHWLRDPVPLFVAGKSMGGRAAASIRNTGVVGALAYGYPLHPAAKPESLRLAPLIDRSSALCIVQGERDKLGDKTRFEALGPWPQVSIEWLPDGDHDLKPRVRTGYTHLDHIHRAADITRAFIGRQLSQC